MKARGPLLARADGYREAAASLRERASTLKFAQARAELEALAAEYERLARFVQQAVPRGRRARTRMSSLDS